MAWILENLWKKGLLQTFRLNPIDETEPTSGPRYRALKASGPFFGYFANLTGSEGFYPLRLWANPAF